MKFNHIVCGGTFDHLHKGHKQLLKACFSQGKRITIGITSRAMVRHKPYLNSIESYAVRYTNILRFAADNAKSVSIITLNDVYGSTLTDTTIDAIYVTRDTLHGAHLINDKRIQTGMKPLTIITIPFAYDDNGDKISSERIRQGLVERDGVSYYQFLISRNILLMPDSLKEVLRKPLGRVISSFSVLSKTQLNKIKTDFHRQNEISLISVGDVITYNFKKMKITPSVSIIDGITQRKALNKELFDFILEKEYSTAPNKKGTIQKEAIDALYEIYVSRHTKAIKQLLIEGEEDLLTLVAIFLAPLNSRVWYGQQGKGAINVLVTEKKKQIVYNLLKQFE